MHDSVPPVSKTNSERPPRLLRSVGPPLGHYLRPGRNDHPALLEAMARDQLEVSGVVASATLLERHRELYEAVSDQDFELVLDAHSVELSFREGRLRSGMRELPWASESIRTPDQFSEKGAQRTVDRISSIGESVSATSVLAPVHFLQAADDAWLPIDAELTHRLRASLDQSGQKDTAIYYPLVTTARALADGSFRDVIKGTLARLPIDALWIRVHPFGTTNSGPLALRNYIRATRDLHDLRIPIIGERTGTVGIALMAFGAVGGIESGITLGERFDIRQLTARKRGKGFSPPPRIYLPGLAAFLSREDAQRLFAHRGMRGALACQEPGCCERGVGSMLANPKAHFLVRRGREVVSLSGIPDALRAGTYMESFLRPASDRASRALQALPSLEPHRRRLDSWRATLGNMHESDLHAERLSFALPPAGRRLSRGAV